MRGPDLRALRVAAAVLACAAAASPAAARAAPPGSPWGAGYFPNVPLVTHEGKPVRFYDDLVKDRLVVVSFVYTSCTQVCGPMTANLARVQRALGDRVGRDIHFYSIAMDPERDTPEALAAYARAYRARPGWTFLTGSKEDVALLRRKLGDAAPLEAHAPRLSVGNDRTGQWWTTAALDDPGYLATLIGGWMDPSFTGSAEVAARGYAAAPRVPDGGPGRKLFRERCAACHVRGGDSVGPDLSGVVARRGEAWLARWLRGPAAMVRARDPAALELVERHGGVVMPDPELTPAERRAVIGHLRDLGGPGSID